MRILLITGFVTSLAAASPALAAEPDPKAVEFFETKIRPVLVEQCYSCHSGEAAGKNKLKGGLRLDSAADMKKGGDTGPVVNPGDPKASLLLKAMKGEDVSLMPPKGKLPAAVIADFEKWISQGAADPRTTSATGTAAATTIDFAKLKEHWAFRPVSKVTPPTVKNPAWVANNIDKFIVATLEAKKLTPVSEADRRVLIRRLTFDLTGLPPTPAEIDAFVADSSPDALPKLVDRLLASPAYGERWARHWLDVARYSEDQAHTFAVTPKNNAFQYRDWVIKAMNSDMPYDRFVKFQLAGDMMPESSGDAFTRFAGLGLLGLGAEYYKDAGAAPQAIADELDDKIDTVTRGFLGLTVACARCHDHKFDPVPTMDYYSLAGVFNGGQFATAPLAPADVVKKYDDAQAKVKEQDAKVKAWLSEAARELGEAEAPRTADYIVAAWRARAWKPATGKPSTKDIATGEKLTQARLDSWVKFLNRNADQLPPALKPVGMVKVTEVAGKTYKDVTVPEELTAAAKTFQTTLTDAVAAKKTGKPTKDQDALLKAIFTGNGPYAMNPDAVPADYRNKSTAYKALQDELELRKKQVPPMYPVAHIIKGGGQTMKVFIRGNIKKPGELAPKRFLQAFSTSTTTPGKDKDFTRLDLAEAIASPQNPLTARVIVNRIWAQHFGRGIVSTPSNFGTLGDKPTHPELLDYLTEQFIAHGWSLKWLHREIVLSRTYRLASGTHPGNAEIDADNVWLWRANRRRLEVEPWRDAILAVAGRLDSNLYGPTTDLRNANNTRRTIYAKVSRHELDGLLRLFDFPDANVTADKRTQTTVPQQQLFVLNSEFIVSQAKALAERLKKSATTDEERIMLAYRLAYGRTPNTDEIQFGKEFLAIPPAMGDKLTRWEEYAQAILASNEFLFID